MGIADTIRPVYILVWVFGMYQSRRIGFTFAAILVVLLAACAPHATVSPPPVQNAPQSVSKTILQIPMRVLIKFKKPTSDSPQINGAIAASCNCQPIFLRMDRADILIYQITLLPGQVFADFERSMHQQAASLQIEFIEQDSVMQPQ
jgi:hypothetical protein